VSSFTLNCGDLYCTFPLNCVLIGCSSLGCKKWSKANEAQRSHRQCPCSSSRPFWKVGCYMHISCISYYTSSMMFRHGSISGDILERFETWDSVGCEWLQTLFVRVIRLYDTVSHSSLYSNEACLDLFLIILCQY
jgi:hypothetical protein